MARAASLSASMTVGAMLARANVARRSAGMPASWSAMWENEAFAQIAPSATSTARASILSRSVASQIGGSCPAGRSAARRPSTYRRMSANGLPVSRPRRSIAGAWLTPRPRRKRPPLTSARWPAVIATSAGWQW